MGRGYRISGWLHTNYYTIKLDLSAAFDKVDHRLLLSFVEMELGMS